MHIRRSMPIRLDIFIGPMYRHFPKLQESFKTIVLPKVFFSFPQLFLLSMPRFFALWLMLYPSAKFENPHVLYLVYLLRIMYSCRYMLLIPILRPSHQIHYLLYSLVMRQESYLPRLNAHLQPPYVVYPLGIKAR